MTARSLLQTVCKNALHRSICQRFVQTPGALVCRAMSGGPYKLIGVETDSKTGVATVIMNRKPVNSLNTEFMTELKTVIEDLENDRTRGMILTSSMPTIFSAGLDIMCMYQQSPESLGTFWRSLQDMWMTLYGTSMVTFAAINGHSPAGGCLMSISCDYRVMASGAYTIGLNETKLGIVAPVWFRELFTRHIGYREAEMGLVLGTLFSGEEALKIGMVNQLVDQNKVMDVCKEEMTKWLKIPALARGVTKNAMRHDAIQKLKDSQQEDIDFFVNFISAEFVQKNIGKYLEALAAKKKK